MLKELSKGVEAALATIAVVFIMSLFFDLISWGEPKKLRDEEDKEEKGDIS